MMTYDENSLLRKLDELRHLPIETEWIEFKEAKTDNFDTEELGKYFSALSNEANSHGQPEAWLVFGVKDKPIPRPIVGTLYRNDPVRLDSTKQQIADQTNNDHTFFKIYDVRHPDGRVVIFQIPPALEGTPTSWRGKLYGRHGQSRSKLAEYERQHFLGQAARRDLSRELLPLEHESDCGGEFVGRQALLARVKHFIDNNDRGLLLIKGPPGQGKSALIAELRRRFTVTGQPKPLDFFYHRQARDADDCVRHLCASLLIEHDLATPETASLPADGDVLFREFRKILSDVAQRLSGANKQIMLIDALDEVRSVGGATAFDRLPDSLPQNVYVIATTRDVPTYVRAEIVSMDDPDFRTDDFRDGREYAQKCLADLGPAETLLDEIARTGAANFLVLAHICSRVRELGCEPGQVRSLLKEVSCAPDRLAFFYKDYLARLRRKCDEASYQKVVDVLQSLTFAKAAVTPTMAVAVSDHSPSGWHTVRQLASENLHIVPADPPRTEADRIRLYHASFGDFLEGEFAPWRERCHARWADYCSRWPQLGDGFASEYAARFEMVHLVGSADHQKLSDRIFNSDWAYQQFRHHADRGQSFGPLRRDLDLAASHLGDEQGNFVRRLSLFLSLWGTEIQATPALLDQWWDAGGDVLKPFPRAEAARDDGGGTLLVPIIGPTVSDRRYGTAWPKDIRFAGAACELRGGMQRVVLASDSALAVYRKRERRYQADHVIRFSVGEQVFGLAAVSDTKCAALVRSRGRQDVVRIIDVTSSEQLALLQADADEQFWSLHRIPAPQPILLVVSGRQREDGKEYRLNAYTTEGHLLAALDLLAPRPEVEEESLVALDLPVPRPEVVPFAELTWALYYFAQPIPLVFQKLAKGDGSWMIETFEHVEGRFLSGGAIPGDRIAVVTLQELPPQSNLEIFDSNGKNILRNRLYPAAGENWSNASAGWVLDNAPQGRLLNAKPRAWQTNLGILLQAGKDHELWSVRPEPQAIASSALKKELGADWAGKKEFLSLADGSTVVILPRGALVAGLGHNGSYWLDGSAPSDSFRELIALPGNSGVLARGTKWLDQCDVPYAVVEKTKTPQYLAYAMMRERERGDICRRMDDEEIFALCDGAVRLELPPCSEPMSVEAKPFVRTTPDGWQITISSDRRHVVGRRAATNESFKKRFNKRLAVQVRAERDGGFVAVLIDDATFRLYRFGPDGRITARTRRLKRTLIGQPRFVPTEDGRFTEEGYKPTPRILHVQGDLVVVENEFRGHDRLCIDLERPPYRRVRDAALSVVDLPSRMALVLAHPYCRHLPARAYLYSPDARRILTPLEGVRLSTQTLIYEVDESSRYYVLRTASIIAADSDEANPAGRFLALQLAAFRFDCVGRWIWSETERQEVPIKSDFACWTNFGNQLAIAFGSGRIEIRQLSQPEEPVAVGYVARRPDSMAISHSGDGRFLAVAAGETTWFDLTSLTTSESERGSEVR